MRREDLVKEYEKRWINEGFLSREHEEMRKKAGEKALHHFHRREESSKRIPRYLEKEFKWQFDGVKFIGRWDRVDFLENGAVIVDFKASEIKNQTEANRRAKNSLQMDLYALSFEKTQNLPLKETRLYFLETNIVGHAEKGEKERVKAMDSIRTAEAGIRAQEFQAKPDWHNCNFCEFKTICPDSYAY